MQLALAAAAAAATAAAATTRIAVHARIQALWIIYTITVSVWITSYTTSKYLTWHSRR